MNGLRFGAKRYDRADVQIAVGPTVEPLTNSRRERVVDGRVTKRALDAHRLDAAVGVGEGGDTDDGVELEQGDGRRWIVEVDLAGLDLFLQSVWQRVCIDLEADGQRGFWRDARADAAVFLTGNGFMQLKRVAPEGLAPERLVAEGFLALIEHRLRVARVLRIDGRLRGRSSESTKGPIKTSCAKSGDHQHARLTFQQTPTAQRCLE